MQCGIQGLPLDTQELIELYYDTYNPDTATRQQLKNFNDLTADVITKGAGHRAASPPTEGAAVMVRQEKTAADRSGSHRPGPASQREEQEVQAAFQKGITALRDFIAPSFSGI